MSQAYITSINGVTEQFQTQTISISALASELRHQIMISDQHSFHYGKISRASDLYSIVEGADPKDLAQTGWAVICNQNEDPMVLEALRPLLQHRRDQATQQNSHFYQEFTGLKGYLSGESKIHFLNRHNANPASPANPEYMPYYLLIVGDPESVPFSFQHQLDVQYGVGRIHFDSVDDYRQYANSVIRAETNTMVKQESTIQIDFFAPQHKGDKSTKKSIEKLISPLIKHFSNSSSVTLNAWIKSLATKQKLTNLFHANKHEKPDLLFCAGHGIMYPKDHPLQRHMQGALVCQDWGGYETGGPSSSNFFSKSDLEQQANLLGTILFLFNCFGAGTPRWDRFSFRKHPAHETREVASANFISGMAKTLLSHENGSLLAMVGHIDKAWEFSFEWEHSRPYTEAFEVAIQRLIDGFPIGWAMEPMNQRYAELASDYYQMTQSIRHGESVSDQSLISLWTACNDASNYVVLGDPATRLKSRDHDSFF